MATAAVAPAVAVTLVGAMVALMAVDWPGACAMVDSDWVAPPLHFVFHELVYGLPVLVCLFGMWLLGLPWRGISRPRHRRLLWLAIAAICIVTGLGPVVTVNQYECYRQGVPGFWLPYLLVLVLWVPAWRMAYWGARPLRQSRPMFMRFMLLFGITTAVALAVRALFYVMKLNIDLS